MGSSHRLDLMILVVFFMLNPVSHLCHWPFAICPRNVALPGAVGCIPGAGRHLAGVAVGMRCKQHWGIGACALPGTAREGRLQGVPGSGTSLAPLPAPAHAGLAVQAEQQPLMPPHLYNPRGDAWRPSRREGSSLMDGIDSFSLYSPPSCQG